MPGRKKDWIWSKTYLITAILLLPLHVVIAFFSKGRYKPRTVAHIGELRHLQYFLVRALRDNDMSANFIAIGEKGDWDRCDFYLSQIKNPIAAALRDGWFFWTVLSRYEVIHLHCMMGISPYLWELPILKFLGRRIVAHFRGCEARDRERNIELHPHVNICQNCDYAPNYICMSRQSRRRKKTAARWADKILVTTPDMKDFWPDAEHLPFVLPPDLPTKSNLPPWTPDCGRAFRIIHVTNQPGIEGTKDIAKAIQELADKGWQIEFTHMTDAPHDQVLRELARSDLAIGKMKMGYYANAQVESMAVGVPTMTWVRNDLISPELSDSGFIFATLETLVSQIEALLQQPEKLVEIRLKTQKGISGLHDNKRITKQLETVYGWNSGKEKNQ